MEEKISSKGGRLVLIKSMLSSVPNYFLSVFKIPIGVARKIEKLQRDFFLGDGVQKRKIHSVDWDSLCMSKKKGGLGIGHIMDKNYSLLAKWVWRFGYEDSPLWKRVICAIYGLDVKLLHWRWQGGSKASHFVKAIGTLFFQGSQTDQVIKDGMQVVLGCGDRIRFWQDLGHDGIPLSEYFPRIFALATAKKGTIQEFGFWQHSSWSWNVSLRRSVFDWEVGQWTSFLSFLDGITIRRNVNDTMAWAFSTNGLFSVKSFRQCLESIGQRKDFGTISDIRGHLQSMTGLSIVFNPRASNKVADNLAKLSSNGAADRLDWMGG
ncbi:hypothetical protein Dsin_022752 [Dipteronia sinensis]|uniref:Uncharacterized protein n=1 Tax=Dipteronia sinensis TaxID=43782 RepID=A0AAE0A2Y6_9ROSI|nr:hypothetical protein Dsin_022752 [Dipteronia sinensis]